MSYYSQAQEEQPGITPQEEIQLRRVYDLLCDYGAMRSFVANEKSRGACSKLAPNPSAVAAASTQ